MCKITHKNGKLQLKLFTPTGPVNPDSEPRSPQCRALRLFLFVAKESATSVLRHLEKGNCENQQILKDFGRGLKSIQKCSLPSCLSAEWESGVWFGPGDCSKEGLPPPRGVPGARGAPRSTPHHLLPPLPQLPRGVPKCTSIPQPPSLCASE